MNDRTSSFEGLDDLHRTLDDGTEMLAALISLAVSQEAPPVRLLEAAGAAIDRLAAWRAGILAMLKQGTEADVQAQSDTLH